MVNILRLSDRVKVKVGKVTFLLAPLSNDRKREIVSCTTMSGGTSVFDYAKAQHLYIKHSLKDVEGITTYDNEKYELDFEGDCLTDECVSDIFTIPQKPELVSCAWQILSGIPDKVLNDEGKPLKGVTLEVISSRSKKK